MKEFVIMKGEYELLDITIYMYNKYFIRERIYFVMYKLATLSDWFTA